MELVTEVPAPILWFPVPFSGCYHCCGADNKWSPWKQGFALDCCNCSNTDEAAAANSDAELETANMGQKLWSWLNLRSVSADSDGGWKYLPQHLWILPQKAPFIHLLCQVGFKSPLLQASSLGVSQKVEAGSLCCMQTATAVCSGWGVSGGGGVSNEKRSISSYILNLLWDDLENQGTISMS